MKRKHFSCSVSGCDKPHVARGYCAAHYSRLIRNGSPTAGRTPKGAVVKWMRDHTNHEGDECLIWPFARNADDGRALSNIVIDGVRYTAPCMLMLTLTAGPRPTDQHQAAHSCGNGHEGCINPKHLRWATPKENCADKTIHGTQIRGTGVHSAKLNDDQVRKILEASSRETIHELARAFGIRVTHAHRIRRRASWKHITIKQEAA